MFYLYILTQSQAFAKSTIAEANRDRSCEIYESLFYELLRLCKGLSAEKNIKYFAVEDFATGEEGVLSDRKIILCGGETLENYPEDVRLVTYCDKETKKIYQFVTNNFELSAKTIADIYKARWQAEFNLDFG